MSDAIDLATQPDFVLGPLTVKPSTLEIVRGADREVLEPRVMQVLVALHQSAPNVVSRDALITQCWEGRVVGDDAINRAIGRLRRLAETDNAFSIETIPRVGYRLVASTIAERPAVTAPTQAAPVQPAPQPAIAAPSQTRRALLYGSAGAGLGVFALGSLAVVEFFKQPPPRPPRQRVSPAIAALLKSGYEAMRRGRAESQSEAVGIYQIVTQQAPEIADGWAGLGLAYAFLWHSASQNTQEAQKLRSQAAIDRALTLDPRNAMAWEAKGWLHPWRGEWREQEMDFRQGMAFHPDDDGLLLGLAMRLATTGRMREAATLVEKEAVLHPQLDMALAWNRIQILWGANRIVEADQAAARGGELFPREISVWFCRVQLLMFTGRAAQALDMFADLDNRPPGVAPENFESVEVVAKALQSGAKTDIDKAAAKQLAMARQGGGYAENAIVMLPALGKVDEAFAVAEAAYFGAGFQIGTGRYSPVQGGYTAVQNRRTTPLFLPPGKAMRKDPRFASLVDRLGLSAYWKATGVKPDYQI